MAVILYPLVGRFEASIAGLGGGRHPSYELMVGIPTAFKMTCGIIPSFQVTGDALLFSRVLVVSFYSNAQALNYVRVGDAPLPIFPTITGTLVMHHY